MMLLFEVDDIYIYIYMFLRSRHVDLLSDLQFSAVE